MRAAKTLIGSYSLAGADLSLRSAHIHFVVFVMRRLVSLVLLISRVKFVFTYVTSFEVVPYIKQQSSPSVIARRSRRATIALARFIVIDVLCLKG